MASESVATGIVLSEDDIRDLNSALSMAWIGGSLEDADGSCDSGVHLKNLCGSISEHLCRIRARHTSATQILVEG